MINRLPETDIAPEIGHPERKTNYPFAGAMLVSGRGHNNIILQIFRYPRWLVPNNPQQNALRPTARDLVALNGVGIYTISVLPWKLGNHGGWQRCNDCIDATMTV